MGIVVIGATFVDIKGFPLSQFNPTGRNEGRVIQVHGGVCRNVVEDIANVELRPVFVSIVDDSGTGQDVLEKLQRHKVNIDYMRVTPDGLGTWLAVFDNNGDVFASISKRPDLSEIGRILDEQGDEIFRDADSIVVEFDMEVPILKRIFALAEAWEKPVYAVVSNMSIALERRDLLKRTDCIVCNQEEAGLLFSESYEKKSAKDMCSILADKVDKAQIPRMVVTMGEKGAVFAELGGTSGICPAHKTDVIDTTGAGDAFFSGVAIGLTYHKTLEEACRIGSRLAASVLVTKESVCPRFLPAEFSIDYPAEAAADSGSALS